MIRSELFVSEMTFTGLLGRGEHENKGCRNFRARYIADMSMPSKLVVDEAVSGTLENAVVGETEPRIKDTRPCGICGKQVTRWISQTVSDVWFCSRSCANSRGFGHPPQKRERRHQMKWRRRQTRRAKADWWLVNLGFAASE